MMILDLFLCFMLLAGMVGVCIGCLELSLAHDRYEMMIGGVTGILCLLVAAVAVYCLEVLW